MRRSQLAAAALIAGGAVHFADGAIGQVVQASTDVSDDLFRYPFTPDAFVVISIMEALAFALTVAGLVGFRAAEVAGGARAARAGLGAALAGGALFAVLELMGIPLRENALDDGAVPVFLGLFGLANLLLGAGLVAAGVASRRAGGPGLLLAWGVWTLLLMGIVVTPAMGAGIAVMGLLQAALGAGLLSRAAAARSTASIALR